LARPSTVRERIYWEYAKLIAESAVSAKGRDNYWAFTQATYGRLCRREISPSSLTRDNRRLVLSNKACAYCSCRGELTWDHIVPTSQGGPDTVDNLVLACGSCNSSKGAKDLLAWRSDSPTPKAVLSKYLKLLLAAHEANGSLDAPSYPADERLSLRRLHAVFGVALRG